ncbi:plasmid recombination protein [Gallibacter intestinalis]|uniref:Plasmid recombination protein n=1 Tax=Gallibacter intestinalis TaxID=2779356 RepID=A0ABR9QX00_9FIRM|nr:plasmid recombination protein [Gallibacter intestinalis]MBE5035418.1 plasmid recombination protein [Gallibacter intestinalis]
MASIKGIKGNPLSHFRHNLRENKTYANKDIDFERIEQNYILSAHGTTSRECMQYYKELTKHVYHRQGKTITTAECVVTLPLDLEEIKEKEFFETSYSFLTHVLFDGDDARCLLANVHRDEAGQPHMHYIFTFPEEDNPKYISFKEKLNVGIEKVESILGANVTELQRQQLHESINAYEHRTDKKRERETIHAIGEILNLDRDNSRKAFLACRRTEPQKYPARLKPKDSFLTKGFFDEFHQKFQAYINDTGLNCTVYKGGGGISFTVDDLKKITAETGQVIIRKEDLQHLQEQAHEHKKEKTIIKDDSDWGSSSWGKERKWERKY